MSETANTSVDLSAPEFWRSTAQERERGYATLRAGAPVSLQRPLDPVLMPPGMPSGGSYWAVTSYESVQFVSRHPELFCSGEGVMLDDIPGELTEGVQSFLVMDGTRHAQLRGLIQQAFTAGQMRRLTDGIRAVASSIVDDLLEAREGDFVELVAKRLPMETLWNLFDVPRGDREHLTEVANEVVGWNDDEILAGREPLAVMGGAIMELSGVGRELFEQRRATPGDDLMSGLARAEIDGRMLTAEEVAGFFVLLAVAGNDTTRHTTSHAMRALCDFPDQRETLLGDPAHVGTAVEEFVRWATPVMTFRRTTTQDVELGGQLIPAGEKVVMYYASANRDQAAFDAQERFNVTRSPNRHLGFGGGGPHYCLGNQLARVGLSALFAQLLTRAPTLTVGEPQYLVSNFVDGVKRMPCTLK
jgi:cytochrome P450